MRFVDEVATSISVAQIKPLHLVRFCLAGLVALATTWLVVAHPALALGEMSVLGTLSVSKKGAATYEIPIGVLPGTSGISPTLSLEYNSHHGNGLLGVGWSLSGLPSIGRCGRTIAQDGVRSDVNYDANDRFCIDDQRLVTVSGAYGADGTEYRTEVESFTRVISRGTAGAGPAWFEVWTKSGERMEFGNTTDSRVPAQGKTSARLWSVSKVSDTKGNYYTVTYTNDTANGQAYPSRIDYTANAAAGLSANNSVRFIYAARPDASPAYQAGALIKTAVRLTNVQAYGGATLVWDYRLTYNQSDVTGRSRLASVTLCDGAANCKPATTLTWQTGNTNYTVVPNVAGKNGTLAGSRPYFGDFNGDGHSDILWDSSADTYVPTSSGTRVLWAGSGNGSFAETANFANQNGTLSGYAPFAADFNRDGRTDIWWYKTTTIGVAAGGPTVKWLSNSNGAFVSSAGATASTHSMLSGGVDINGDNRTDLVWDEGYSQNIWTTQSDGSVISSSIPRSATLYNFFADFNGDAFTDVLWIREFGTTDGVWLGNGNGTFQTKALVDASIADFNVFFADVNGDGNADIFWDKFRNDGGSGGDRIIWLSKGDGTFAASSNPGGTNGTLIGFERYFSDFNGDGKVDVLWDEVDADGRSKGTRVLWLSNGDGTFSVTANFANQNGNLAGYVPLLVDFNGDGKADILWDSRASFDRRSTGTRVIWLSDGVAPDLVTGIQNGLGATTAITYRPLTDPSVYSKESSAQDPIVDLQTPMQVVFRVDVSNGIGGTVGVSYTYVGAKGHYEGRGFLGFHKIIKKDLQTDIAESTEYYQVFPYSGLVKTVDRKLGAQTVGSIVNTHSATSLGGTRYFTSLQQTVESGTDLDGTSLPTVTTSYQYDSYGNQTQVAASASDGLTKTTNNTYTNNTTNWLLGRLATSNVTSTIAQSGGPSLTCTLPWGGTINNGQSIAAYASTSVACGQTCASETRTCNGGVLSGSFTKQNCSAASCTNCSVPTGTTWTVSENVCTVPAALSIAHGATTTATDSTAPTTGSATYSCSNGTVTRSSESCTASTSCSSGGVSVGGHCWYMGSLDTDNCNTVCASRGGYKSATASYAGSGGTNANCKAVIDAVLGGSADTPVTSATGSAAGCVYHFSYSGGVSSMNALRYSSPATSATASPPASVYTGNVAIYIRACSCNN